MAEWAGVVVTSFGFVGAIITVHIQGRSVRIQEEQHNSARQQQRNTELAAEREQATQATAELERWARAVHFRTIAKHQRKIGGLIRPSDGQLSLLCKATVGKGRYTNVALVVPDPPTGFETLIDRCEAVELGSGPKDSLEWKIEGPGEFEGDDERAATWLEGECFVKFTDPNGQRWRKDSHGHLEQIPPENTL